MTRLIAVYRYAVEVEYRHRSGSQVRRRYYRTEAGARTQFARHQRDRKTISVAVLGPLNTPVDDDPVVCRWERAEVSAAESEA